LIAHPLTLSRRGRENPVSVVESLVEFGISAVAIALHMSHPFPFREGAGG
jgi:hypothetical protein